MSDSQARFITCCIVPAHAARDTEQVMARILSAIRTGFLVFIPGAEFRMPVPEVGFFQQERGDSLFV